MNGFWGPETVIPLVFGVFLVIVVIVIVYSIKAAAKRRAELFALANQLGLAFSQQDPFYISQTYSGFGELRQGDNRQAYNVLYGRIDNYDVKAFDYKYETHSSDSHGHSSTTTHRFSAILLDTDVHFQELYIRPEGFFDRVAKVIGFDDIDFESDEFSRKFFVKSPDKKFAYDMVHATAMEYLLSHPGYTIHILGRSVLVESNCTWRPEQILGAIEFTRGFMALIPDYLWEGLRATPEVS